MEEGGEEGVESVLPRETVCIGLQQSARKVGTFYSSALIYRNAGYMPALKKRTS